MNIEIGTIVGIVAVLIVVIGGLLRHERRYTRLESTVNTIKEEIDGLKPLKDTLNALELISKNPAIVNIARSIKPPGAGGNPYDFDEKDRLLNNYQEGTIDNIDDAKRLKEILNEDLETEKENSLGVIAVGLLLLGLGALIGYLLKKE